MIVELFQTLPKRKLKGRYESLLYNVKNVLNMRKTHTQSGLGNFQPFLSMRYKLGKLLESCKILVFKRTSRLFTFYWLCVDSCRRYICTQQYLPAPEKQ